MKINLKDSKKKLLYFFLIIFLTTSGHTAPCETYKLPKSELLDDLNEEPLVNSDGTVRKINKDELNGLQEMIKKERSNYYILKNKICSGVELADGSCTYAAETVAEYLLNGKKIFSDEEAYNRLFTSYENSLRKSLKEAFLKNREPKTFGRMRQHVAESLQERGYKVDGIGYELDFAGNEYHIFNNILKKMADGDYRQGLMSFNFSENSQSHMINMILIDDISAEENQIKRLMFYDSHQGLVEVETTLGPMTSASKKSLFGGIAGEVPVKNVHSEGNLFSEYRKSGYKSNINKIIKIYMIK